MVKAEGSINIGVPVEKVWDLLIDSEKLPEWMPLLIDVSDIEGEGVGETFKWTYKFLGIKFNGSSTVAERETNKKSGLRVRLASSLYGHGIFLLMEITQKLIS